MLILLLLAFSVLFVMIVFAALVTIQGGSSYSVSLSSFNPRPRLLF